MQLKQHLIDTFKYNDYANKKVLEKIRQLPQPEQCIKYFSHLINSQNKWIARIAQYPQNPPMDWWEPVYTLDNLEREWDKSLTAWIEFLDSKAEDELFEEVKYVGYDGTHFAAKLKDIALQLNYHSIHHRANIQSLIRAQGFEPDFVDYIGTVYKRV